MTIRPDGRELGGSEGRRREVGKTIIMKEEKKDGVDLSFPASEVNRTIIDGHIWGQPWRESSAKKRTRN